jgi:hypothetical protein
MRTGAFDVVHHPHALEQLRRSRANVRNAPGVPTLPQSVAGIQVSLLTNSLANDEA